MDNILQYSELRRTPSLNYTCMSGKNLYNMITKWNYVLLWEWCVKTRLILVTY